MTLLDNLNDEFLFNKMPVKLQIIFYKTETCCYVFLSNISACKIFTVYAPAYLVY